MKKTFVAFMMTAAMASGAVLALAADVPSGSYRQTCRSEYMQGNALVAQCRRIDGTWKWTALSDAWSCNGRISNMNGNLVCEN